MPLFGITGHKTSVNRDIVNCALDNVPALLIDCANCANVHHYNADLDKLMNLFVIPAESLYRFIPTLKDIDNIASQIKVKKIFITTFTNLFNYDNDEENWNVFNNAWDLIKKLSEKFEITLGIEKNTIHDYLSKKHGVKFFKMGHTVWSQRIIVDTLLNELNGFGKALRENERVTYSSLLKKPLKHLGSISYTSSNQVWAFLLLSIILEQEKKINKLNESLANRCI